MFVKPNDWRPQGISDLETAAWNALRAEGSVCVTAGAGAGKTEFLAQKAAYLLQTGICPPPKRILAISFKRDAARTLADRVATRCETEQARRFISQTFDAFAKSLVDQFRMAIPAPYRPPENYVIAYPKPEEIQEFLNGHKCDCSRKDFVEAFSKAYLPYETFDEADQKLLNAFWGHQYSYYTEPFLTFQMINRLAEFLLRTNKYIKRAFQLTYGFVFLDEFQDTTEAQFQLLNSALDGSHAVITAVGDEKQKIMGWAGAMGNAFTEFGKTYKAENFVLQYNYRSHSELVAIQNKIAAEFYLGERPVIAQGEKEVLGDAAAIWDFQTIKNETDILAQWVAHEIRDKGVAPNEIAILVRNKADDAEAKLKHSFEKQGLSLRNLARNLGDISIQDLLLEEFTNILLAFLRLATETRAPEAWQTASSFIEDSEGVSLDDEIGLQKARNLTENIIKNLRKALCKKAIKHSSVQDIVALLIDEIGIGRLRSLAQHYQRDVDFQRVKTGFEILLSESMHDAGTWPQVLDKFEGKDQVSLLTIHKSKGMEFNTMIFFGLDNNSWWSLTDKPDKAEEKNAFYVTFTRAKQRAFFTSCREEGQAISWLDDILGELVPHKKVNSLSDIDKAEESPAAAAEGNGQ